MCFTVFLFEIVWIGALHCYMKQEQTINENKVEKAPSEPSSWDESSRFGEENENENDFLDIDEMKEDVPENEKDQNKSTENNF